jgi:hypothetical protein
VRQPPTRDTRVSGWRSPSSTSGGRGKWLAKSNPRVCPVGYRGTPPLVAEQGPCRSSRYSCGEMKLPKFCLARRNLCAVLKSSTAGSLIWEVRYHYIPLGYSHFFLPLLCGSMFTFFSYCALRRRTKIRSKVAKSEDDRPFVAHVAQG